jgi:hypothetical protein
MKLAIEVDVPPRVLISTELLASLVGAKQVLSLYREGKILPGQRRSGCGSRLEKAVSSEHVAAARAELEREQTSLAILIQGVSK